MRAIATALAVKVSRYSCAASGNPTRPPLPTTSPSGWRREWIAERFLPSALPPSKSNVQVHDFERVVLDEFAARFHVFAHQRGENVFCRDGVFEFHLEQRARVRVHGGFPELRGIHLARSEE